MTPTTHNARNWNLNTVGLRLNQAAFYVDGSLGLVANALTNTGRLVGDLRRDVDQVLSESERVFLWLAEHAGHVQEAMKSSPRFLAIIKEGLRVAAGYRWAKLCASFWEASESEARWAEVHEAHAERVADLCLRLGGGVLKLGQFLSCRMDLLPEPWIRHLAQLQDQVPASPIEEAKALIEEELGQSPEALFSDFDPEPVAAASLAQVYGAKLHDGRDVVVKVQRPGIAELVQIDLAAMRTLTKVLESVLPPMDLPTIMGELGRSLGEELDYRLEAQNIADFGETIGKMPGIVIPEVVPELSTERVLTMSRIRGERLTVFLDACEARDEEDGKAEKDAIFAIMIQSLCAQVLQHGLLHGDPHPGNFLVCPGPRLAVLDFGSVQRYTPAQREAYGRLAGAILTQNTEEMARHFSAMGFETRDGDIGSLVELGDMLLESFRHAATFDQMDIDPRQQMEQAMKIARQNPVVQVPDSFVQLGRVFGAVSGLMLFYKPKVNLLGIIAPHLTF